MDRFDARKPGALSHSGTFNGNPVSVAAGLATLRELTPAAFDRLDALSSRLGAAVRQSIDDSSLDARFETVGSLFQVWSGKSAESANATGASTPQNLYLGLLLEGFAIAPRGMGAIPTVASETDIDELARAITSVLASTSRRMAVSAGI